jgi:hypothetical protein
MVSRTFVLAGTVAGLVLSGAAAHTRVKTRNVEYTASGDGKSFSELLRFLEQTLGPNS